MPVAALLQFAAAAAAPPAPATAVELTAGVRMPLVMLGTWYLPNLPALPINDHVGNLTIPCPLCDSLAYKAVTAWLTEAGGRGLDTAFDYQDQGGVGRAIRDSGVPREEIFITTKVPGTLGYDKTIKYVRADLERLGVQRIDLLLLHYCSDVEATPLVRRCENGSIAESWRALEDLHSDGTLRAIGVSNFCDDAMAAVTAGARVRPMVNEVERHPGYTQDAAVAYARKHGTAVIGYQPLASRDWCPNGMLLFAREELRAIASRHGVSPAQVLLRWQVQDGVAVIPRVGGLLHPFGPNVAHMRENLAVMAPGAFNLTEAEMAEVAALRAVGGDNFWLNKCSPVAYCPENRPAA